MEVHVTQARTAAEQLWYKDAIIYQLLVKSFFDSNNDGIGDFPGLISKLDYIADLGVNAIWCCRSIPRRCLTTATILVAIATFIQSMARSTISVSSSARRMPAIFGVIPITRLPCCWVPRSHLLRHGERTLTRTSAILVDRI